MIEKLSLLVHLNDSVVIVSDTNADGSGKTS